MATPTQEDKPTPVSTPLAVDTSGDVTMGPSDTLSPPAQTKPRSDSVSLLQSTRPAPPSPAPSRPGSQLFNHSPNLAPSSPRDRSGSNSSSRIGSSMNRRVSGASSRHSDREKTSRRKSTLGHNFSLPVDENEVDNSRVGTSSQQTSTGQTTPAETTLASTPIPEDTPSAKTTPTKNDLEAKKPIHTISIRDYGFPENDERFFGRGQIHAAKKEKWRLSNFTLGRRPSESASGEGSPKSPDPNGSDTDDRRGWGFGFLSSGWKGFARKRSTSSESSPSVPIHDEPEDTDDVDDDDYFSDDHDDAEEPFGMYRAAYSFEAEGEHEMSMTEGDVIEVRGRGGGEGWVIGIKGGKEGLVPEGYLERYIPGRDAQDDEEMEELQDDKE